MDYKQAYDQIEQIVLKLYKEEAFNQSPRARHGYMIDKLSATKLSENDLIAATAIVTEKEKYGYSAKNRALIALDNLSGEIKGIKRIAIRLCLWTLKK